MADTNKPAVSEQNNPFTSASEPFQNCGPVTPPINSGIARIGKIASIA